MAILDLLGNKFCEENLKTALVARMKRTIDMSIKATGEESLDPSCINAGFRA